ncbi:MAG: hypothetical protein K2N94_15355, partial [Lachnospiraceae bacterium]|nr:hypothetical protein [Lachnospiraceae bacterium]
ESRFRQRRSQRQRLARPTRKTTGAKRKEPGTGQKETKAEIPGMGFPEARPWVGRTMETGEA